MNDNTSSPPGGASDQPPDGTVYRPEGTGSGTGSNQPVIDTPQAGQPTMPISDAYSPPPGYVPPTQDSAPQGYQPGYPQQQAYQPPTQNYGQPQPQQQYPQQAQYPQQQYPQQVNVAPKKGGMPGWLIGLLIGLAVLVLLCGAAIFFITAAVNRGVSEVENVANGIAATAAVGTFDISLRAHDYEGAHSHLGGNLASRYSVNDLQSRWEALESNGSVNTDMSEPSYDNKRTFITWSLTPSGGTTSKIRLTVEQSGDEWKITGADPELIPSP